jgi:1,4-dihydroxy-2-naphthoate octaprenyltransferase
VSAPAGGPAPSVARIFIDAARPRTLAAAVSPVLVGSAVAATHGSFRADVLAAALLASLLIQIGANYANDVSDHLRGADTADRLGPPRATALGLVTPRAMTTAAASAFALAAAFGLFLVTVGGLPVLVVGIASIAAAVLYTGGPWPLGYHGLGDLVCFVFFGIVPVATLDYLHAGGVSAAAWWASVPVASLVTAILVVNNLRDLELDRAVGKRTFAVLLGRTGTRVWYSILLAAAYVTPLLAWALEVFPLGVFLVALTAPIAQKLGDTVSHREGRELNAALAGTSRLHLIFGALLSVGLLLRF